MIGRVFRPYAASDETFEAFEDVEAVEAFDIAAY
jgi:hypothetical protein